MEIVDPELACTDNVIAITIEQKPIMIKDE